MVPVGVPQGSILGPLLFLIYVNDLPNCLEHCQVVMYADDTAIYFSANCCQNIEYHLNADLANLAEWSNNNYLTLNTSKSKFVLFGGDRRLQTCQGVKLVIDHENLECDDSIKYLGVVLHENLTWNARIESLIAKVNQRIGLLNRIKHLLPLDSRVALYNALIRPLFDFADTIWGDRDNITLKGQCPDYEHARASSVFSPKDSRTVKLTQQDSFRTAPPTENCCLHSQVIF